MKRRLTLVLLVYVAVPACALAFSGTEAVPEAARESAHEAPNPFAGTIYQAIAAAIVFLLLLVVLKAKAWGPILKGLQDRENKIKGDLEQAEQAARRAAETLTEYQAKLAAAQEEARKLIERGRSDAEKIAAQVKDQVHEEIEQSRKRAQADIRAAREQALADIYAQTAALATSVAGRILQRELKPDDQRKLVENALAELNKPGRN